MLKCFTVNNQFVKSLSLLHFILLCRLILEIVIFRSIIARITGFCWLEQSILPQFVLVSLLPKMGFAASFSGGLRPLAPPQGLGPWTPQGAAPPDPCHSSLAALASPARCDQMDLSKLGCTTSQQVLHLGGQVDGKLWTDELHLEE